MSTVAALILFAAVTVYAVFGGADFGAGCWDLVAGGPRRGDRPREVIDHSIGPVWEANHVWLIFVFVVLWTCFPTAYASITLTLFVPLTLAALGIVLRGASFAFRKVVIRTRDQRNFGAAFALGSVLVPYCLGAVVGSIASGRVPSGGEPGDPWSSWVNPTSVLGGVLAVCTSAYLAAFFLVSDAHRLSDDSMVAYFRRRAVVSGVVAGVVAFAGIFVLQRRRDLPLRRAHALAPCRSWSCPSCSGSAPSCSSAAAWCAGPGRRRGRGGQRGRGLGRGAVGLPAPHDPDRRRRGGALRDDGGRLRRHRHRGRGGRARLRAALRARPEDPPARGGCHRTDDPEEPTVNLSHSPFPPIADYGFLSDCHTGALVAPDGSVDWLCIPAFDSPSVFGSILDRGAGSFRFGPYGINVPTARTYEPGTNVLVTTWHTPSGWIVVRDALVIGARTGPDTVTPHTRPPADDDAAHLMVRTVECVDGSVEVELVCEPAFDYGRVEATWTLADAEGHRADAADGDGPVFRLSTDMMIGIEGGSARARHVLSTGETAYCALSWAEGLASPADADEATAHVDTSVRFWRDWLARARIPDHALRPAIERSALTIKGLTYMPTGATVAALTTSLPETPGGERNWDYRYTWMRDTTFTLQALHYLNLDWEADEFIQFVADLEPNPDGRLQIMYGIDGRRDLTESTRDELSGYEGAQPVRLGNGAFDQKQNDVFGAVLDSLLLHTRRSQHLPRRLWPLVQSQAAGAIAAWREPDQGIWEARGEPQHYVSSKLMGWVALDRAAKLAAIRDDTTLEQEWAAVAEEIRGGHPGERGDQRGRAAPALRFRLARRLDPARAAVRLPPGHRRADPGHRRGDLASS